MSVGRSDGPHGVRDQIPPWIFSWRDWEGRTLQVGELMEMLIAYSAENVRLGPSRFGGGPYAAAVVRSKGERSIRGSAPVEVVALATNAVEVTRDATAHASVLALRLAGAALNTHNLGSDDSDKLWLIATCEPCRMCLEVTSEFRVTDIGFAIRGAIVQPIARQRRGEQPRVHGMLRRVHLSEFQGSAAEVVRGWRRRQDASLEPDYNPDDG